MSTVEYRPVLICQGCRRHNAGDRVLIGPMPSPLTGFLDSQSFDSPEAALAYGRGMARNVYGADVHSVEVESRAVIATDWGTENALDQAVLRLTTEEHEGQRLLVTVWGSGAGEVASRLDGRWGVPTRMWGAP